MSKPQDDRKRCAIYTRKSSEEGLEQSFNSLDAQREACDAFIASQRHEGWCLLPALYDDGGYSGGDMDRPGLQRLLNDVEANQVDVIVVYKVDRLTRSLADFAKIVEALDSKEVSFVSVTQQFNTTTSMGRLTLNILLSFAQFEREVTGERIRDKIAASKRKGMWMGGSVPLGYDVKNRKLVVNQQEAKLINDLYRRYLELGSVPKLKTYLDENGIKSKERISAGGVRSGGVSFFRGALYWILQNRIYIGQIRHRDQFYPGLHEAILQHDLWERVQAQLKNNNGGGKKKIKTSCSGMLAGLLQDGKGNRFHPTHTVKNQKRYRYYFSRSDQKNPGGQVITTRLPAHDVEKQVCLRLQSFLRSPIEIMKSLTIPEDHPQTARLLITAAEKQVEELSVAPPAILWNFVRKIVLRVLVQFERMTLEVSRSQLRVLLMNSALNVFPQTNLPAQETNSNDLIRLAVEVTLKRWGGEMRLVLTPDEPTRETMTPLVKTIVRAYKWREQLLKGHISEETLAGQLDLRGAYLRRVLGCAFLAPDIVDAILDGRHHNNLTVRKLTHRRLPLDWAEQRIRLGLPAATDTQSSMPDGHQATGGLKAKLLAEPSM
jgi:site-specific DNA recombinase